MSNSNVDVTPAAELNVMLGSSRVMQPVFCTMARASVSPCSVLITGGVSTGKTLCSRLIHASSVDRQMPLHAIDCSVIREEELLSQLNEQALASVCEGLSGRLTLVFKEIGELSIVSQRRVHELFSDPAIASAVRLMATSSRRLGQEVDEGRFLRELFLLLNDLRIDMPPLRHRKDDIVSLAAYYLGRLSTDIRFSEEAVKALLHYAWPGNMQELISVVSYAVEQCSGMEIEKYHLPSALVIKGEEDLDVDVDYVLNRMIDQAERASMNYDELHGLLECRLLHVLLERFDFHSSPMAAAWQMNRVTLLSKRKRYGLP